MNLIWNFNWLVWRSDDIIGNAFNPSIILKLLSISDHQALLPKEIPQPYSKTQDSCLPAYSFLSPFASPFLFLPSLSPFALSLGGYPGHISFSALPLFSSYRSCVSSTCHRPQKPPGSPYINCRYLSDRKALLLTRLYRAERWRGNPSKCENIINHIF